MMPVPPARAGRNPKPTPCENESDVAAVPYVLGTAPSAR